MGLETNVQGIQDLNENWPLLTDLMPEANEHLQNIKKGIRGSFNHIANNGGVVTVTADEMNALSGVTSNVQTQLDNKPDSLLWSRRNADTSASQISTYLLQPGERVFVGRTPGDTLLRLTLPLIAASSDQDTIEVKCSDTLPVATSCEVDTQQGEQMLALNSTGAWVATTSVVADTAAGIWPHIQCTFQAGLGNRWVVRLLDVAAFTI